MNKEFLIWLEEQEYYWCDWGGWYDWESVLEIESTFRLWASSTEWGINYEFKFYTMAQT